MHPIAQWEDTCAQVEEALAFIGSSRHDDPVARAEALYAQWYPRALQPSDLPAGCPRDLAEMMRAAHAGFQDWESGWRVENVGRRGQVIARRGVEARLLERIDYASAARPGVLPRPGEEVSVPCRRDRVDPDDGWWRTSGRLWSWVEAPPDLIRLYFNLEVAGLPALIERLTHELADETDPWLLKCATNPAMYARADAIVAYLTPRAVERRASQIVELANGFAGHARARGPALTIPVAPGLAAAVDPGGNESFGAHRCRLIAEAARDTVEAVLERFADDGVDPARPWARRADPRLPWER
jgi:hypothetical protein